MGSSGAFRSRSRCSWGPPASFRSGAQIKAVHEEFLINNITSVEMAADNEQGHQPLQIDTPGWTDPDRAHRAVLTGKQR